MNFKNNEEKSLLIKSLEMKQSASNLISKIRFDMKVCNGIMPLHQRSYKLIKKQLPNIPSQFIIKAEQDVISKYQSIRQNHHKIDSPITFNKLSINLDKRIYKWIDKTTIKLTTYDKRIFCNFNSYDKLDKLFNKYKLKDPSLFVKNDEVILSIVFDNSTEFINNKKAIGIDLGIKRLVATSEGIIIKGNEFNKFKRRIRRNKKKLQSRLRNSHSARIKLKKLKHKERNFSKNYTHHVVNNVLRTDASKIVVEDLSKIKSISRGKRFNNRLSQVPFYLFRQIITYKAQSLGKRVEMVKPYFTSQNDYRGIESGVRRGCRYYASDGVVLDADLNAANNILKRGSKHSISCCKALDGQVVINQPIVGIYSGKPLPLGRGS